MDSMSKHSDTPPNKKLKLISNSTENMENNHKEAATQIVHDQDSPDIFDDCSPSPVDDFNNGGDVKIQIEDDVDMNPATEEYDEAELRHLVDLQEQEFSRAANDHRPTRNPWQGVSLAEISRGSDSPQLPPIQNSRFHHVLFQLPVIEGEVPAPFPSDQESGKDKWDNQHVRMPCSPDNQYVVKNESGESEVQSRWQLIEHSLLNLIENSRDLEAAIFKYNMKYKERWNFRALHYYFDQEVSEEEGDIFFSSVLPGIIHLALRLPQLVKWPIPLLRQHASMEISLSQLQVASLLANAFLCTFPRRNAGKRSEYSAFPDINFSRLFASTSDNTMHRHVEKLKCLFNYFRRVVDEPPVGTITFSRRCMKPSCLPQWERSERALPALHVTSKGTIEDQGGGMLQVDFANCYVGGGVLGSGCVQEEIRFVICPELIVSRLFTEELDSTEALLITGIERFSDYSGYGDSFAWVSDHRDSTPRDSSGRLACSIVAIDALHLRRAETQFEPRAVRRELNKAYVGFANPDLPEGESLVAVATGNWGCGAFNGDPALKALVQLMAAAHAGRGVAYFTFGDTRLVEDIGGMHSFLCENAVTVGRLWRLLSQFHEQCRTDKQSSDLYSYLYNAVLNNETSIRQSTLHEAFTPKQNDALPSTSFGNTKKFVTNQSTASKDYPKSRLSKVKTLTPEEIEERLLIMESTPSHAPKSDSKSQHRPSKRIVIPESSPESTPEVIEKESSSSDNSKPSDSIFYGQNRDRLNDSVREDDEVVPRSPEAVTKSDDDVMVCDKDESQGNSVDCPESQKSGNSESQGNSARQSGRMNNTPNTSRRLETVKKGGTPKVKPITDYFKPISKPN